MGLEKTPKTFNARFEKEVFWAIAELLGAKYGRDKTEVVKRAILEAQERLGGGASFITAATPVVPVAVTTMETAAPFNPRCVHCGENFGAWNRGATVCSGCKAVGHWGDPRACDVCTAGSAI